MLEILDTGVAAAQANMDRDKQLLDSLNECGNPILHLYEWEGLAATYGYFIDPGKYLNLEKINLRNISLGRRPTGGGIVFHISDFAFSLLIPSGHPAFSTNTLDNYRFVNGIVLEVVSSLFDVPESWLTPENFGSTCPDSNHFCMAKPTQYDVLYKGMKVAGAAQRKKAQGYLHQGTISLGAPQVALLQELLLSSSVLSAMTGYTFSPQIELEVARKAVRDRLVQKLMEKL
jgi:lipoate-protein ligase A